MGTIADCFVVDINQSVDWIFKVCQFLHGVDKKRSKRRTRDFLRLDHFWKDEFTSWPGQTKASVHLYHNFSGNQTVSVSSIHQPLFSNFCKFPCLCFPSFCFLDTLIGCLLLLDQRRYVGKIIMFKIMLLIHFPQSGVSQKAFPSLFPILCPLTWRLVSGLTPNSQLTIFIMFSLFPPHAFL